ncbi:MAG: adenosylcobalamin-dependent ribonucleoside-diphosphate reductase [Desulfobacterota bacterium]|nr:adenosylcobalamin-dependent ribonucleoside-diphosphate reductase [Thermodesulfobacteriota bacterium]MDW8002243.1 adenosylcobalamin-dependent ribonucleoside-diphosphate reductase [Deltaproteobacteria bacterium]
MLDPNALIILERRYLLRDKDGKVKETPEDMFYRVASHVALAEKDYGKTDAQLIEEKFFLAMRNLEFLPNSPCLMNAGKELGQLAACFVIPVEDSLDSIFEAVKLTAKIHQSGGGTGFSFSKLRPKGDIVQTTMGVASGPVSFMKVFNMTTEVIKQGGTRRGANMGVLRIDHPDVEEFITVKRDPNELTNFNLSVAITDDFMASYFNDGEFELVNPRDKKVVKKVKAKELMRLLSESAYMCGEPGCLFIDTINRENPLPHLGDIEATNPCSEQPLLPYESCCLGSINLCRFVDDEGRINWEKLKNTVHLACRFLDDVIDVNRYPHPEIERMTKMNRKIGLGVMGFAHMLIKMGIPYDSERAERVAEEVMSFIQKESKKASAILAEERGTFPSYRGSKWERLGLPQRNGTTTTVAPTGTLSLIAGTSSGIEPIFDLVYSRIILGDIKVEIEDPLYREFREKKEPKDKIIRLFRTAYNISPEWHLRIQLAFQKHIDNGVSKTVNLPEDTSVEDVEKIFVSAYKLGLKGITVFRNRSRKYQVLSCSGQTLC